MLISLLENQERFLRTTAVSVTWMTVGKRWFPLVQRLATNLSKAMDHPTSLELHASAGAAGSSTVNFVPFPTSLSRGGHRLRADGRPRRRELDGHVPIAVIAGSCEARGVAPTSYTKRGVPHRVIASLSSPYAATWSRSRPTERSTLSEELAGLIVERNDSRIKFIKARFHRDAAAVYYDSVVTENAAITRPAWDSFSAKQTEMDIAGDHLYLACTALVEHALRQ